MSNTTAAKNLTSVGFIIQPQTIDDLWQNAKFQCDNVSDWIDEKDPVSALIKLEFLKDAIKEILIYKKLNRYDNRTQTTYTRSKN